MRPEPGSRWLPREELEDAREVRLILESDRLSDTGYGHGGSDEHLLSAFDPAAEQVFMRSQARSGFELRGEMHAREAGRRSDIAETYGFGETGLDIFDGSVQLPSWKHIHRCSAGGGNSPWPDEKPRDNGDADAVGVHLSE